MAEEKVAFSVLMRDYDRCLEKKHRERSKTFDFFRGLAVLFMVMVHVLGTYSTFDVHSSVFGEVIEFLGGPPAAPVFMFSMGVFYILSTKSDRLRDGVIKGIKLVLLGCLLSFLRSDLITLLGLDTAEIDYSSTNQLASIWEVDILQFAGWAYIIMSLIKRYFKKPIWWLIIATGIMVVSSMLWGISSNVNIVNWIFNFLWGTGDYVYFPIFGWLFYPLIGMIFGVYMQICSDHKILFKTFLRVGLVLMIVGSIITVTDFEFHIGDYYRSGIGSMIWIIGFVYVWLWVCNKITMNIRENKFISIINYWGRETPIIYFIHWVLTAWGTTVLGYEQYGYVGTLVLTIFILLVTHLLTRLIKKYRFSNI